VLLNATAVTGRRDEYGMNSSKRGNLPADLAEGFLLPRGPANGVNNAQLHREA
jgi:hypothetical protein